MPSSPQWGEWWLLGPCSWYVILYPITQGGWLAVLTQPLGNIRSLLDLGPVCYATHSSLPCSILCLRGLTPKAAFLDFSISWLPGRFSQREIGGKKTENWEKRGKNKVSPYSVFWNSACSFYPSRFGIVVASDVNLNHSGNLFLALNFLYCKCLKSLFLARPWLSSEGGHEQLISVAAVDELGRWSRYR